MPHQIEILGRSLHITLSKSANIELAKRDVPLLAEMELYFSCLIRKQVRFRDAAIDANDDTSTPLNEHLQIRFRPVMTRACGKDYEGDEPPLTDFPITNEQAYVPRWLRIDYRRGQWLGEFGYEKD